jgi:hypothetical protein
MSTPSGRSRRRWEDKIRMDRKEVGINTRNWVDSAKGLLESPYECGTETPDSRNHGVNKLHFFIPFQDR